MGAEAKHEAFTAWAKQQGVVIKGVAPAKLPGKGFGIVATRHLKKGESVVNIPASAMITHDSDFVRASGIARGTVYGTVAAALTVNHENEDRWYRFWQDTWPSREDFETSMPLCWTQEQQELLTPTSKSLLKHQREKYDRDFRTVKTKIPEHLRDWYQYYWLVVNTRCFYWVFFKKARDEAKKGKKLPRDECLALVPWGDYFNHEDHGCEVTENATSASVVCDRNYSKGEEVVVSYGSHSNDYLLVEYGFMLGTNKHDCTTLDHIIIPLLTDTQRELLDQHQYLGEYYITSTGFCYRTQVAIRAMVTSNKRMENFLAGEYDGQAENKKIDKKTRDICVVLREEIELDIDRSKSVALSTPNMRWNQLLAMLNIAETAMFGH